MISHKHRCSKGHTWEHFPPHPLSFSDAQNKHDHTCAHCGEVNFDRFTDEAEIKRLVEATMESGAKMAGDVLSFLAEKHPVCEAPEALAMVKALAMSVLIGTAAQLADQAGQSDAEGPKNSAPKTDMSNISAIWDRPSVDNKEEGGDKT